MYKRLYHIGFAAYAVLLVFSVLLYKERMIISDTAFALFNFTKDHSFSIQVYRFGDVFNQLLPVLAVNMGSSLDAITVIYSISFVVYYLSLYIICGSLLKQYELAICLLLTNILFVSDTFYWTISQLPQSVALVITAAAFVSSDKFYGESVWRRAMLALLIVTIVFFHPLAIFAAFYVLAFFFFDRKQLSKKVLFAFLGSYVLLVIIKALFFHTAYERHSLSGLKNFLLLFPNYLDLHSNRQLLSDLLTKYYWMATLFAATVIYYWKQRKRQMLFIFVVAFIGYLLLINVSYPSAETPGYYVESLYLPLSLFLALPFVFDLMPALAQRKIALPIFLLIMATGCIRIYATHNTYLARLNWERAFLQKNGDKKIIADAKKANAGILQMLWGTPYEFWLLSTIETGKSASIIIDEDPKHREWAATTTKSLVVNYNVFLYSELPPRYFVFTDTTSGYIIDK